MMVGHIYVVISSFNLYHLHELIGRMHVINGLVLDRATFMLLAKHIKRV